MTSFALTVSETDAAPRPGGPESVTAPTYLPGGIGPGFKQMSKVMLCRSCEILGSLKAGSGKSVDSSVSPARETSASKFNCWGFSESGRGLSDVNTSLLTIFVARLVPKLTIRCAEPDAGVSAIGGDRAVPVVPSLR